MATLKEGDYIVEVKYTDWSAAWVNYAFRFSYCGVPLFNPEIREKNYFFANEYLECSLIPTLERVLENDEPARWIPLEPDMSIEIIPWYKQGWKDYEQYIEEKDVLFVSEEYKERLKIIDEQRKETGGKLPDDSFEFIFGIDDAQLKPLRGSTSNGYSGYGPALKLVISREKLILFLNDLKTEYHEFQMKNKEQINADKDKLE